MSSCFEDLIGPRLLPFSSRHRASTLWRSTPHDTFRSQTLFSHSYTSISRMLECARSQSRAENDSLFSYVL